MSRRGAEFAVSFAFQMLRAIYGFEQAGREPSLTDLADFLKTSFHVISRYRRILEQEGMIEVVPEERKNIVRLTERGRCVARCLVS